MTDPTRARELHYLTRMTSAEQIIAHTVVHPDESAADLLARMRLRLSENKEWAARVYPMPSAPVTAVQQANLDALGWTA